jgi:pilus assembly protein Flp/PilA
MLDFKKLFNKGEKEEGQGLVEYALILFLVAVVVIAILILLGPQIGNVFSQVTKGLS